MQLFEVLSPVLLLRPCFFDKGNNSKKNIELLDRTSYHFVGSLKPKFQLVPRENGEENNKKDDIFAYRTREEILGVDCAS
jgi:transposase